MLYYCPTVLLVHIVLTWRNEQNSGSISRNGWNASVTKEGSSQDVQSSHLQSLDQGNARVCRLCRKRPRWAHAGAEPSSPAVLPDPPFSGPTRTSIRARASSLPAAAATGHVTQWRRALQWLFPSVRRGAGLQLRRGGPPSCSRPPSAHLRPQPCPTPRGTAGRLSPSSAARRTDFRSARRPPPAPGAWRRLALGWPGGGGWECRRLALPPCPHDGQDRALGGPPAPKRAGKPAAVAETETARPSLPRKELAWRKIWKAQPRPGPRTAVRGGNSDHGCHSWVSSGAL